MGDIINTIKKRLRPLYAKLENLSDGIIGLGIRVDYNTELLEKIYEQMDRLDTKMEANRNYIINKLSE